MVTKSAEDRKKALKLSSQIIHTSKADRPYAHNLTAQIYRFSGRTELAIHHWELALKNTNFGLAYYNWADMLVSQKKNVEALEKYDEALKLELSDYIRPYALAYSASQILNTAGKDKKLIRLAIARYQKAASEV
jgi:tetratricopeptide (TPR) repeat protein